MPLLTPETLKKLQPKRRMIANGDTTVNVRRAERSAAIAVDRPAVPKSLPRLSAEAAVPVREATAKLRTPSLKAISKDILTNLFVYMRDADVPPPDCGGRPHGRRGQIVQVQTTLSERQGLADDENVAFVEIAEALKVPTPALSDLRPRHPHAAQHERAWRIGAATMPWCGADDDCRRSHD